MADEVSVQKKGYPRTFWTVITMEFFERGSYYGVMSVLSVFLVMSIPEGGLGFSKEGVGAIKSTITPLLYFLPILSGALADRYGYRRVLMFAFVLLSLGYFLTSLVSSYALVFASLIVMALGAGLFKPIISGTIAKTTNEKNSSQGFSIYYWSINLGAFLFPLLLIPWLKSYSWSYIFIMASIFTGAMLFLNIFVYREPNRPENKENKSLLKVLGGALLVLKDFRFMGMILIYSCFWILYFQMYDSVLWYLKEYMDMRPVNNFVNSVLSLFVANPTWKFDAEHVTVINAGAIIILQIPISLLLRKTRALTAMIVGIGLGTAGIALLAISGNAWLFIASMLLFSIGEMTAHPKFFSYVGLIAPADKKALYLGYSFLYGVIGSGVGGILGAFLYVNIIEGMNRPGLFWMIFAMIGAFAMVALFLFDKYVGSKRTAS
jgi:dipeptide/tripeptide permease